MNISEIMLLLFTLNLAIAFGAGLYETRIVLPLWFKKAGAGYQVDFENMRSIDTGRKFWGFITTIPLTLLTIANLILALQSHGPIRSMWLTASLIVLVERIATLTFFIPVAIKLQKAGSLHPSKTGRLVAWWIRMNYIRNMLTFVACLMALKCLTFM
jgi:hypothetical protein